MDRLTRQRFPEYEKGIDVEELTKREFVKVPHDVFNNILMDKDLTKREKDILWMIIRLTFGCRKNESFIKRKSFKAINIYFTDATRILEGLEKKELIRWSRRENKIYLGFKLIHTNRKFRKIMKRILRENMQNT